MSLRKTHKHTFCFLVTLCVLILPLLFFGCAQEARRAATDWPVITNQCRPWSYWWWLGSAVDEPNLTALLEDYSQAGMGGMHIIPIYGVKGEEDKFIDYLSPQWMDMLAHTVSEAKRVGMGIDMTVGTGWPFGGPQVTVEDAAAMVFFRKFSVAGGKSLDEPVRVEDKEYALEEGSAQGKDTVLKTLIAYSDKGDIVDLTAKVGADGKLDWVAPADSWQLYAIFQGPTGQQVKRAAPGAEGNVMNPFSKLALENYLKRFDDAFAGYQGQMVRAFYNDSYEVYGANWTDDFFEQFKERRGYDLRRHLPALAGKEPNEVAARVKCDYRQTLSDLQLENYIMPWVKWSNDKGVITRNQAHGSPGNLLDLYGAVDVPETEIFGPSDFDIPGLPTEPNEFQVPDWAVKPDVLVAKFASSAAHVTGKKLVSSETCTWLGEHFRISLSQVKPEIDKLFVSGINHVFYHGMAYSPVDDPWPGWQFYASTNFAPTNSFWRDISGLNNYIGRCQSILQTGEPANDILLYFPIYDVWHNEKGMEHLFTVHHELKDWLYDRGFHKSAKLLWDRGYTFDYVSDRQLADAKVSAGQVRVADVKYRVVVVPRCRFVPLHTAERLIELATVGATVVVEGELSWDVPGFGRLAERRRLTKQLLSTLTLVPTGQPGISRAAVGKGQILVGENLEQILGFAGICREPVVDNGIEFIRRRHRQGHHYFLANLGNKELDGWVKIGVEAKSVVIFDPLSECRGLAAVRNRKAGKSEVYLQLKPGQSCILRTFAKRDVKGSMWHYLRPSGQPVEIEGTWKVVFIDGGPELPVGFETTNLSSWTELGGAEAKSFAGTAKYTIAFDKPAGRADDWLLDLGKVCFSARVRINGKDAGILFSVPFEIPVGKFLREGKNELEVEVTNLSANRIADLDRHKVGWQKFYNINFISLKYKKFDASGWAPMDSGLLGPVQLIPTVLK